MAISRCNKCGFLHEPDESMAGQEIPCPKCAAPVRVYHTLFFVNALLKKHTEILHKIKQLQSSAAPESPPAETRIVPDDLDLFNTRHFTSEAQHEKIKSWFLERGIQTQTHPESVDTTGFYDEIGTEIASNFTLYKEVLNKIRWAQREGRPSFAIHLAKKSAEESQAINAFCQKLYDTTLLAKILFNANEQKLTAFVQGSKNVQEFFNGAWLEWHALMSFLTCGQQQKRSFSCTRNLNITLGNGDKFELDVFGLIDSTPVCIECKSGEFRPHIEKAQILRKKLGIDSRNFIMCISGLDADSLPGLSAMHKLTFANEATLAQQLKSIVFSAS